MKRDLFKERHPLLHAFFQHPAEAAGLAFVLIVILEICTFCQMIRVKLDHLGSPEPRASSRIQRMH